MTKLSDLAVGDPVRRDMAGITMDLKVTDVTATTILCGPWTFSRRNGAELDEELGWGEQLTGSFIKPL